MEIIMYSLHYFPDDTGINKWYIKDKFGLDHGRYAGRINASKVYAKLVDKEYQEIIEKEKC